MKQWLIRTYKTLRLSLLLVASYVKSHRLFFFLGMAVGLLILVILPSRLQFSQSETIGLTGNYTISNLPLEVQNKISLGLTKILPDGTATSAAALSWKATDSGRIITFNLDPNLTWQNGNVFSSNSVNYNLRGIQLLRPNSNQVEFILKEPFAPLIAIVSQPLFKDGLIGLGSWKVNNINLTARFVSSLSLTNSQNDKTRTYKFYPTESSLLTALKLGSVNQAQNMHTTQGLENDHHYQIIANTASSTIATLFFNLESENLSDKSLRQGLVYALPNQFSQGIAAFAPVVAGSWTQTDTIKKYAQNLDTATKLIAKSASQSGKLRLTISTPKILEDTAKIIAEFWKKVGVEVKVEVTDLPNPAYDVFLTYLELPVDPDQYSLWHSTQQGNISHYKSPKVDKLLEDGRKTLDPDKRKDIYAQFYRAITEDVPAAFLFYPNLYTITRK